MVLSSDKMALVKVLEHSKNRKLQHILKGEDMQV